ncbi:hypothetical protein KL919_005191 [Ogataea angusta]|nr:hypothetical protein KL919_005191 [Ogataea angusta]
MVQSPELRQIMSGAIAALAVGFVVDGLVQDGQAVQTKQGHTQCAREVVREANVLDLVLVAEIGSSVSTQNQRGDERHVQQKPDKGGVSGPAAGVHSALGAVTVEIKPQQAVRDQKQDNGASYLLGDAETEVALGRRGDNVVQELADRDNVKRAEPLDLVLDVDGRAILQLEQLLGVRVVRKAPGGQFQKQGHEAEADLCTHGNEDDGDPQAARDDNQRAVHYILVPVLGNVDCID